MVASGNVKSAWLKFREDLEPEPASSVPKVASATVREQADGPQRSHANRDPCSTADRPASAPASCITELLPFLQRRPQMRQPVTTQRAGPTGH